MPAVAQQKHHKMHGAYHRFQAALHETCMQVLTDGACCAGMRTSLVPPMSFGVWISWKPCWPSASRNRRPTAAYTPPMLWVCAELVLTLTAMALKDQQTHRQTTSDDGQAPAAIPTLLQCDMLVPPPISSRTGFCFCAYS